MKPVEEKPETKGAPVNGAFEEIRERFHAHTTKFLGLKPPKPPLPQTPFIEGGDRSAESFFAEDWNGRVVFQPAEMERYLQAVKFFVTVINSGHTYVWNRELGIWVTSGKEAAEREMKNVLRDRYKEHYFREAFHHLQVATYEDLARLMTPEKQVIVANGMLSLETGELSTPLPEWFILSRVPWKYDPEATCPAIEKFISEIVHAEDVPVIQELFGYCLLNEYPYAKAWMMFGAGANGKSTLLELLKRFLGEENVSNVALQDLLGRRFAPAELYGKLANILADLTSKALQHTGMFKMLTGRDRIMAEKKYQHPFYYMNYAKLVYSANEMPDTKDLTHAFWRRWIMIDFPNRFEGDDADPEILDKITIPGEMSGLLNWALAGMRRVWANNGFTETSTTTQVQEKWRRLTSSVYAFLEDRTMKHVSNEVPKDVMYAAYAEWCQGLDLTATTKTTFSQEMPRWRPGVLATRPRIRGKRIWCWRGIQLKGEVDPEEAPGKPAQSELN
ncbi:hypothetical protein ES707_10069 [subsurface metagenome]